ncbi:hypothetical protein FH972_023756 [Carpinus fangiana]|uniref:Carboxylic ester hydrolase n=1 Tax=Carpinus fangiana TaxID=176857 RepID=A0A5N6KW46_9ROSI|nr:hypothetical protein FH972_023756 [Carpinus fangiana]
MAPLSTSPPPPSVNLNHSTTNPQILTGKTIFHGQPSAATPGVPKCSFFGRIPYAQAPIGELRFRRPRPLPDDFNYANYGGAPGRPGDYSDPCLACTQAPAPWAGAPTLQTTEDCLRLNIWVPLGSCPPHGWPVLFYLHGGFLQYGGPSQDDPSAFIAAGGVTECVVVAPAYRLGILGFLASREVCGQVSERSANFGLWDQRAALEWTARHVGAFGGDAGNITVAGMSSGAYSAFHQLAYDLRQPKEERLVRRVVQWSNGCGVQPKAVFELQEQFKEVMDALSVVNPNASAVFALDALREKTAEELVGTVSKITQKFFRPVTDGSFIVGDTIERLKDGRMTKAMKEGDVSIMIGDVASEASVYATMYPPQSWKGMVERLSWDYPQAVVETICSRYKSSWKMAGGWTPTFGKVYAKMQVYAASRGQIDSLVKSGLPHSNVYRYSIEYRSDASPMSKIMGSTHGTDLAIWFLGNGKDIKSNEKEIMKTWLKPLGLFIRGEKSKAMQWGTTNAKQVRTLTISGDIKVKEDSIWEKSLEFWNAMQSRDIK